MHTHQGAVDGARNATGVRKVSCTARGRWPGAHLQLRMHLLRRLRYRDARHMSELRGRTGRPSAAAWSVSSTHPHRLLRVEATRATVGVDGRSARLLTRMSRPPKARVREGLRREYDFPRGFRGKESMRVQRNSMRRVARGCGNGKLTAGPVHRIPARGYSTGIEAPHRVTNVEAVGRSREARFARCSHDSPAA
jgi:hypothetical protein